MTALALRKFLAPPVFADEDKTRTASLLHAILLTILAGIALYVVIMVTLVPDLARDVQFVIIPLPIMLGLYLLMRRGHVELASGLLAAALWINLTIAASLADGLYSPAFDTYIAIIIIAGLLLGGRAGLLVAGVSILSGGVMTYAELNSPRTALAQTMLTVWVQQSILFLLAAVLLWLAARNINAAFKQVRRETTERQQAEERRAMLYETLHAVGAHLDPDAAARAAVEVIGRLGNWASVAISLANPDGQTWTTRAGTGPLVGRFGQPRSMNQGVIGRAYRTGQMQLAPDVSADPDYFAGNDQPVPIRSELAMPLKHGEQVLGVLNLESEALNAFSPEDISLAESLAGAMALAFENARLYATAQQEIAERKQAEERLRRFYDLPLVGMAITSPDRRFLEVNDKLCDMLGYPADELVGQTWVSVTHPDDVAENVRLLDETVRGETEGYSMDKRFIRQDGSAIYASISARAIRRPDRSVDHLVLIIQDITNRKQAEAALRESERRFQDLLANVQLVSVMLDTHGVVTFCNDYLLTLTGWRRDEVLGRDWFAMFVPEERSDVQQMFLAAQPTGHLPAHYENPIVTRSGEQRVILWNNTLLRDAEGQIIGTASLGEDITERQRAEAALHASENFRRLIVETEPECVKLVASNGDLIEMNWAGLDMIEADSLAQVQDKPIVEIVAPEYRAAFGNLHKQVMRGESGLLEFEIIGLRGTRRWLETHAVPFRDKQDHIAALLGVTRDITERKRAEEALRAAEIKYRSLVELLPLVVYTSELGAQGVWPYVSPQIEPLLGFTPEEWRADPGLWYRQVHPDDRDRQEALEEQAYAQSEPFESEYRIFTRAGREIWVRDSAQILPPHNGGAPIVQGVLMDITARKQAEETSRAAENKYRNLVERLSQVVYTSELGTNGVWSYVSPQIEQLLGYAPQEWLADPTLWYRQVHPEDRDEQLSLENEAYVRNEPFESEYRILTRIGNWIWVRDSGHILPSQSGGRPIVQGILMDVSERKRAEEALSVSKAQLLANLNNSPNVAVQWYDKDGRVLYWNPASETLYGWKSMETIGKTLDQLIHTPEEQAEFMRILSEIQGTGKPFGPYEARVRRLGGTTGWVLATTFSIPMNDEQIGFVCMDVDITERRQAEEKIERQNQRLKALREIDTAILAADSIESIVGAALSHMRELIDCHRASLTLIDWGTNEALIFDVKTVKEISFHKGMRVPLALFQDMLQTLPKNQPVLINDLRALADPPPQIQSLITEGLHSLCLLPLFSQSNLIGSISLSSEISGFFDEERINLGREVANQVAIAITQSRLVEALQHLNADLERRVIERTTQLEAANKELEAFSYSVSHDLRAPLRSIDGFSRTLLEDYADRLDAQGANYLQRVRAASQRMAQLIDDLLELSRLTRAELRWAPVSLSALALAVAEELRHNHPERAVEFVIAEGLTAEGDARLLRIALENLLGNAWKFTAKRPQARIEFGAARRNGETIYVVRDNGAGFDMEYADKLFGAFQRLHSTAEFPGTGIGLATVQRIIHRHGGRLWAEGAVEQGAAFYFTLPPGLETDGQHV